MSTDYTQTLKSIKEAEEKSSIEISERKKALEENLRLAEEGAARSIAEAKKDGESLIASDVERARLAAQTEAEKLLASTEKEANKVASNKLSATELRKILDENLFSEFKGV